MIVMPNIKIEIKENPKTGANEAYVADSLVGFFEQMDPQENTWSFMQKFPNDKMTGDHYIAIGEKLNELNAKQDVGDFKIEIEPSKIGSLTKISPKEKRFIYEHEDDEGRRLELYLTQVERRGKLYIGLFGVVYLNDNKLKELCLGAHKRNKNGVETIVGDCDGYEFDKMFSLVLTG
tara:strand:- start:125 stop:655 length:531 start_codon:yes stop_codon:yes gene_type:complete